MTEIKKHRRLPHNRRKHLKEKHMSNTIRYGKPEWGSWSINETLRNIVKWAENDRKKRKDLEDFTNGT